MKNEYRKILFNLAVTLDKSLNKSNALEDLVCKVVESKDNKDILSLYEKIISIVDARKGSVKRIALSLRESLFLYLGYSKVVEIVEGTSKKYQNEAQLSIEELLEELNELVGLDKVKEKINDLVAYQKVKKEREVKGYTSSNNTQHLAFIGNPGTGKTTVARIVGHIYKQLGLLSIGHFMEVSRTDLIAGYQGQTALKVKKVIEQAKGGVLFIDEAYSITENESSDSYGRECLTELTKALEDYREDLVVIVAGYVEPMQQFFDSNPGLRSRFNTFIEFDDYSASELLEILCKISKQNNYKLDEHLKNRVEVCFDELLENKEKYFANGRLARNIFDDLVINHARRVAKILNPTDEELVLLKEEDFLWNNSNKISKSF